MKWISNTYDPTLPDARLTLLCAVGESPQDAWKNHVEWLRGKTLGEPKATEECTVEQLKEWGYVGVYI